MTPLFGFPEKMVLLDCETTGGNSIRDRLTEIALIEITNGVETDRWQTLINPGSAFHRGSANSRALPM